MNRSVDVAIIGSGFAGSILARILARQGLSVVLVERGEHPRFALGESTTPLANFALERLARRYGLPDLFDLATHGRWLRRFPQLPRGLKRGFTFYRHRPGTPFTNGPENDARLLVAASPEDALADSHWLRADVDHHLVRQAVAAGVDYRPRTELTGMEEVAGGWRLTGSGPSGPVSWRAAVVVDGSGAGGFVPQQLGVASALERLRVRSGLIYGHFRGVEDTATVAARGGASLPPGPYPDHRAAVHHLLDEGWIYLLPFDLPSDEGRASAGLLVDTSATAAPSGARWQQRLDEEAPEKLWREVLGRYPTLEAQLGVAEPLFPLRAQPTLQHRWSAAAGRRWLLLPHTFAFVDPMFSTGMAWSLLAVERLAELLVASAEAPAESSPGPRSGAGSGSVLTPPPETVQRYGDLLEQEVDQIDRLVAGAYRARPWFDVFTAHSFLYFATVSFAELQQRLTKPDRPWAWDAFLAADDPATVALFETSLTRLDALAEASDPAARQGFIRWVETAVAPKNLIDLADPGRRNLYPVDLDVLLERCHLLGMSRREMEAALPRLRGGEGLDG